MTKLPRFILALAISLAPIAAQAASPPKIMYPDFYEYHWRKLQCLTLPYFKCDYTDKTCMRGYATTSGDSFVGVLLAEDRQTVLAHLVKQGHWFNVDTGEVQIAIGPQTLTRTGSGWFKITPEQLARARDETSKCFPHPITKRTYEPVPE